MPLAVPAPVVESDDGAVVHAGLQDRGCHAVVADSKPPRVRNGTRHRCTDNTSIRVLAVGERLPAQEALRVIVTGMRVGRLA